VFGTLPVGTYQEQAMHRRDWFGLGVRGFGLWVLFTALTYFISFADIRFNQRPTAHQGPEVNSYLFHAVLRGAFGAYLLFGAQHLAHLCYGKDKSCDEANSSTPETPGKPGP